MLPAAFLFLLAAQAAERVGPSAGGTLVATGQLVRPAGDVASFPGRPVDLVVSGKFVYVKDNRGLVVLDAATWKVVQQLPFPRGKGGGSMHGLAVRGDCVFATTSGNSLCEAEPDKDGKLAWQRTTDLPGPGGKGASYPT